MHRMEKIMIRISQLKMPIEHNQEDLIARAAKLLKIPAENVKALTIVKQSVDARKKEEIHYIYTVDVKVGGEKGIISKLRNPNVIIRERERYCFPEPGSSHLSAPPVVVGSGPAGLFCAVLLARSGYRPVLLERGADVDTRTRQVADYWKGGPLDTRTNVQFGEGGAGTFSDGKLNTLVKDTGFRNHKILELFVEFGADPEILYVNKPHIGTDVLSKIVKNMRMEIIESGGQVRFLSQVTDFLVEDGAVTGVVVNEEETIPAQAVILAVGHSARDTFELLLKKQVPMQSKSFAVGLRIQHPQTMINLSQYGSEYSKQLGAASYKLTGKASDGRGIYSFCMCPGGYVVNASSEEGRLTVNGMSYHDRAGDNGNSALIVAVTPEDFPDSTPLSGIAYQRGLEELAYRIGDGKIPVQLYGDFKEGKEFSGYGDVAPAFKGLYQPANLKEMLPSYLSSALIEGIEAFDKKIRGFGREDAILAGIESRTSSPVRIVRDEAFESSVKGLFPCGEGAGYAGGITSAAMDGIRIAEEICRRYAPISSN